MRIRLLLSALAVSCFVAASAGAGSLPGAAAPSDGVDLGTLKAFVGGGSVWAEGACQKATEACDTQHPCCGSLSCVANLFDKTKVCDFRG
jgi:hypothetical protein